MNTIKMLTTVTFLALAATAALPTRASDTANRDVPHPLSYQPRLDGTADWPEQKVSAGDTVASDQFAFSVAVSGEWALFGAQGGGSDGDYHGAAYIFRSAGGSWSEAQKLLADDGAAFSFFGYSVAINGTTAAVGAWNQPLGEGFGAGAVYVFSHDDAGNWRQTQKLLASDAEDNDGFGYALALEGSTLVVGASHAGVDGHPLQGAAYVFSREGGTFSQTRKLTAADGATSDEFGGAVAISGDTILVGARGAIVDGGGQGAAYLFNRVGDAWSQSQKLSADDERAGDHFGVVVALDGATAVIGSPEAAIDDQPFRGAAYLFTRVGANWSQTQKLLANDGIQYDNFGKAVAISGDQALIGAPYAGGGQGQSYVFTRADGGWSESVILAANDGDSGDMFGFSVAFDGTTALSSAYSSNMYAGAGYLYTNPDVSNDVIFRDGFEP